MIWTSPDGASWTPMALPTVEPHTIPIAVAAYRDGFVAVGASGADADSATVDFWHSAGVGG